MKYVATAFVIFMVLIFLVLLLKSLETRSRIKQAKQWQFAMRAAKQHSKKSSEDRSRLQGIVDVDRLDNMRVAIPGAGSIGSHVAYYLSSLVGEIVTIDIDTVDNSNTAGGRTIYNERDVGKSKVVALKQHLESANKRLKVYAYQYNLSEIPDDLLFQLFAACDLIICAVDDLDAVLRINQLFYGRIPLIFSGFFDSAREGFIAVTTTDTPCFRCSMQVNQNGFETLHGESGLGLDISMVSHYLARIAIGLLDRPGGGLSDLVHTQLDAGRNIIHIANRTGVWGEPFSVTWLPHRIARCDICH
jgi:molybdopterin/thiamine biosynthesis adenylyltransferase